jgi:argininosuccinate synthase
MIDESKDKVILLFSGGLDTSFCVPYLIEHGYDVITLALDPGGFSEHEKNYIENRSKELGAIKHYMIDIQKELTDKFISKIIKANALHQGVYPLMCSDRYLFGKYAIGIAKQEGAVAIAHGCTASGNDQIRVEAPVLLKENFKIITPIKDLGITRPEEIKYLEDKGFSVPKEVKKYTLCENILGICISGSEVDDNKELPEDAWVISKITKKYPEYIEIEFEGGLPVGFNGYKISLSNILYLLNKIAGSHGYGRALYVCDQTVGIKGRQAFEAPGVLLLVEAHKALEKLVLTNDQLCLKNSMDYKWTELAYTKIFDPLAKDVFAFIQSTQKFVNGTVKIKLFEKGISLCEISSANGLVDESVATYAQNCTWTGKDIDSFTKFYTLQSKIFYNKNSVDVVG